MILVGIDDTDMPDTPGTNKLAMRLAEVIRGRFQTVRIVRHQLCADPSIPCTSQNGSACLHLEPESPPTTLSDLLEIVRREMRDWFVPGSDPGLCVAPQVSASIVDFGRLAQTTVVTQQAARDLARREGIHLEGLGGTEGGVIGALAAVGLSHTGNDGRIVAMNGWSDDIRGIQPVARFSNWGVSVREFDSGRPVSTGHVDLVKKLRPSFRDGHAVLFVEANGKQPHCDTGHEPRSRPTNASHRSTTLPTADWIAVKLK